MRDEDGNLSTDSLDRIVAADVGVEASGKPDFIVGEYVTPWLDKVKVVVEAKAERSD